MSDRILRETDTYAVHKTRVNPDFASGETFLLDYRIYKNGRIIVQTKVVPKDLGYEYATYHHQTISDFKIIEIRTSEDKIIWSTITCSHTGFQLQKIW